VHQPLSSSLGIPYIFKSLPVKSPEMFYAHTAFGPDGGGSGTVEMALRRGKTNKKQSLADIAAQDEIHGSDIARRPKPAAAHENVPADVG
jgi:hypothetical protein